VLAIKTHTVCCVAQENRERANGMSILTGKTNSHIRSSVVSDLTCTKFKEEVPFTKLEEIPLRYEKPNFQKIFCIFFVSYTLNVTCICAGWDLAHVLGSKGEHKYQIWDKSDQHWRSYKRKSNFCHAYRVNINCFEDQAENQVKQQRSVFWWLEINWIERTEIWSLT